MTRSSPALFEKKKKVITGCNLLARTLVINFTEEFSSEIGLKSETFLAPSILGMRVM